MSTSTSIMPTPPATAVGTRRWAVLGVVAVAQLMIVLNNTVMNIALAPMQIELGVSNADRQWVVTSYALAFGSLLLLGGRLADLIGRRRALLLGLGGGGIAALFGGAADSFTVLVTARAAQGAFAALSAPAALSLLTESFAAHRGRATALGVFSAIVASGATVGLLVGGLLTQYAGWRWCLNISAAIALVAVVGAVVLLPAPHNSARPRVDLPGALTVSLGLMSLVYGFGVAATAGWSSPRVVATIAGGVVLLVGFVLLQRRAANPLLPLRVVRDRDRGGALLTLFIVAAGMFATTLFTTYFLQRTAGLSPVVTGLAFLPMVALIVAASTTVPSTLLPRLGPKPLIAGGLLLGAGALTWLSRITVDTTYAPGVLGPLMILGLAVGTVNAASINTATKGVEPDDVGAGSAIVNTMPQVGGAMSIALLSTVAATVTASSLAPGPVGPLASQTAAVSGYGAALSCAAVLFLFGAVVCGPMIRRRPTTTEDDHHD